MSSRTILLVTVAAVASLARLGSSDVWDAGGASGGDNVLASTRNELVHGSGQVHDLAPVAGGPDNDWYRISLKPYSSYEAVVDGTSVAIGPPLTLELTDNSGAPLKTSVGVSAGGYSRTLTFYNDTATAIDNRYIHVKSGGCTTTCTAKDVYRIRFFDTTLSLARFNNTGTQETYVILQNPTNYTIKARVHYFGQTGDCLCKSSLMTLTRRADAVIDDDFTGGSVTCPDSADSLCHVCEEDNTDSCEVCAGIPEVCGDPEDVEGLVGHALVLSDTRYGDLSAKGSALDPAGTLWEFDTEMPARPY